MSSRMSSPSEAGKLWSQDGFPYHGFFLIPGTYGCQEEPGVNLFRALEGLGVMFSETLQGLAAAVLEEFGCMSWEQLQDGGCTGPCKARLIRIWSVFNL